MPQQRITRSNEIIIQSENSDMDVELLDETEEKKTELVPGIYTARSTELLQGEENQTRLTVCILKINMMNIPALYRLLSDIFTIVF